MKDKDLNQVTNSWQKQLAYAQQLDHLRYQTVEKSQGLGNRKNNGYEMVKKSSDQIPQLGFDRQNIARVPHRFYGQVTYND